MLGKSQAVDDHTGCDIQSSSAKACFTSTGFASVSAGPLLEKHLRGNALVLM